MSKKITLISSEFPPLPGGIGNHAFNLARFLDKNKFDIQVITDQRASGVEEKKFDSLQRFGIVRVSIHKIRLFMYIKRVLLLLKYINSSNIIIASGKFSLWSVGFLSVFFPSKKYIAVVHGTEVNLKRSYQRKMTEYALSNIKNIICVSNYTASFILKRKNKKIHIVPNGFYLETDTYQDKNFSSFPNLVTVGRISKRKGQHNVVKAIPALKVKYPNLCYHIIGIDTERESIINLAKKLGVEKNIKIYGKVENSVLYSIVHSSDVFCMLSEADKNGDIEGFGIAIIEANSLGVPAIGALNTGIEDAIDEGNTGKLVDVNAIDQIVDAIDEIILNKSTFKKKALDWSNNFSWNKVVKNYIKIIEE